jgi:hypothetical protein
MRSQRTISGFGWFTTGNYAAPKKSKRHSGVPESPYVIMARMRAEKLAAAIERGEAMEHLNCRE